jgi:hypothetical protein
MTPTNLLTTVLIVSFAVILGALFKVRRQWIGLAIVLAFLLRVLVAYILAGDLEYTFVIDSLEYEMKGWYLTQAWISGDTKMGFSVGHINNFTLYDHFLGFVYDVFGNHSFIAPICNCFFATLCIFFMYRIAKDHLSGSDDESSKGSLLWTICLAGLYPSFLVWSATNIRDPLYFLSCMAFFYFFLATFSRRQKITFPYRALTFSMSLFCLWLVYGLRAYIMNLLLITVLIGLIVHATTLLSNWKRAVFGLSFASLMGAFLAQTLIPEQMEKFFTGISEQRMSFSNTGLAELYAKSSFALDQQFSSISDLLFFLPTSLSHYFFGPFPWEVSSVVQAVSLLEAFAVYIIAYPTIVGIKRAYQRAPFATTVLICFVAIFAIAQSVVISNMGTIYRHRTLPFLVLLIFSGEGIYEIAKKNTPAFFKT